MEFVRKEREAKEAEAREREEREKEEVGKSDRSAEQDYNDLALNAVCVGGGWSGRVGSCWCVLKWGGWLGRVVLVC